MLSAVWLVIFFFFTLRFHRLNPFFSVIFRTTTIHVRILFFSHCHCFHALHVSMHPDIGLSFHNFGCLFFRMRYRISGLGALLIIYFVEHPCYLHHFFVANFQLFFSPSTLIYTCFVCIWGCKLCPSFKHVLVLKIQDSHYLHTNFAKTFTF